jgi:GT2 family glycosyltransferase/O-antigen/teichoic acid export membrane protein
MAVEASERIRLTDRSDLSRLNAVRALGDAPTISVVICAYTFDRFADVLAAIESVQRQDLAPTEIIVVVDHNESLLAAIGNAVREGITLVSNRFERGLSGARNTGIAEADGGVVAFFDDDAVADPSCLRLLAERCAEPGVIGAGALIEPLWPDATPSWFPGEFLWVVGCTYKGLEPGKTRNLLGAAMCMRSTVFLEVGGFDGGLGRRHASLPFGCEETELCIRATRSIPGSFFVFEPAARVDHKVSTNRVSWRYFVKRCYAEGLSKAHLTRLVGADSSLANERNYARRTLMRALARNAGDILQRGEVAGFARIAAIAAGLTSAAAGFAIGQFKARRTSRVAETSDRDAMNQWSAAPQSESNPQRGTLAAKISGALRPHVVLFSNAGLLGLGTATASVLGFFYWWAAAHMFSPSAVGYAAAAISLMNFIGHVGETGMGALLIGDAHRFRERASRLIGAALVVSAVCSTAFGVAYIGIGTFFPVQLGNIAIGWVSALFVLGCGLTGLTLVLDQALVGMLQSQKQLVRNVYFSVAKLAMLAAAPLWLAGVGLNETSILITWVVGQLASLALLLATARKGSNSFLGRPEMGLLKPLLRNVLGHHGLNLANLAPGLLMPFIVTIVLAPSVNAAFYAAWTVINVAFLAPASLATVVYAVGAKDLAALSAKVRVSLGSSLAVGVVVATVCYFGANLILSLFSPLYADIAGASFSLLGLSVFPIAVKYHYVSIQRLRNRMLSASFLVGVGCALELAGAIAGGLHGNLLGLSVGWLIGLSLEAALMAPVVLAIVQPNREGKKRPIHNSSSLPLAVSGLGRTDAGDLG